MEFDLKSAMENNIEIDKEGISTETFDFNGVMQEERRPKGGGGVVPRFLRNIARNTPLELIRSSINLRKAIKEGKVQDIFIRPGESYQELEARLDRSKETFGEFVKQENEETIKEGIFRQLEAPIAVGIGAQIASAGIVSTAAVLGTFTVVDLLFDLKEGFNKRFPNANPNLVDAVEFVDILAKAGITGGIVKLAPGVKARVKSDIKERINIFRGLKPASVKPEQIKIIQDSKNLTSKEKTTLLEKAGITEEVGEIAVNQNKPVKTSIGKVEEFVNDPAFKKVKNELIGEITPETPQETPLVEAFKKARKERTDILTKKVSPEEAGRISKGQGFQESAVIRKLKGEPTATELKVEQTALDRLSIGKLVETPEGTGTIASKPSFGRFKVKVNGKTKTFETADLTAKPTTSQQAIDSLRTKAEIEAKEFLQERGVEGDFDNIISKEILETRDLAPDEVIFHGSTKKLSTTRPESESATLDQLLGLHGSNNPGVASNFTRRRFAEDGRKSGESLEAGRLVKIKKPENPKILEQARNESDQFSFTKEAVNSSMNKVQFNEWINGVAKTDKITSDKIFNILKSGKNVPIKEFGAKLGFKKIDNLGEYVANLDSILGNVSFKTKKNIADGYINNLKSQGFDGIQYQNTSKFEISTPEGGVVKDKTSFVVFKPENVGISAKTIKQELPKTPKQQKPTAIEEQSKKTAKAARDVADRAVEQGLTEKFGGLAEFEKIDFKDQAKKANQLLQDDPVLVQDIIAGTKEPPGNILKTSIFNAVEQDVLAKGDVLAIKELAQSPLASSISRAAQELGVRSQGQTNSPIEAIKDVENVRTKDPKKKFSKKRQAKETKNLREAVKKETPKLSEWESFIKGLEC